MAKGVKIGTLPKHALTVFALGGLPALLRYSNQIKPGVYACPETALLVHARNGGDGKRHTFLCCCNGTNVIDFFKNTQARRCG